jgi:hypothetical protein
MNYAAPVFGAVLILAVANYILQARHYFRGPIREVIGEAISEDSHYQRNQNQDNFDEKALPVMQRERAMEVNDL